MRVQDVMTTEVKTVSAETTADEAWDVMKARGIHHLVVTKGRTIVGMLSHRDAGGRLGAQVRKGHVAADS